MKKYDRECEVVVVGAGMGGMTCALALARKGKKVEIIEQGSKLGGYLSYFKRNNFLFEACLHVFGDCEKGVYPLYGIGHPNGHLVIFPHPKGHKRPGHFIHMRLQLREGKPLPPEENSLPASIPVRPQVKGIGHGCPPITGCVIHFRHPLS